MLIRTLTIGIVFGCVAAGSVALAQQAVPPAGPPPADATKVAARSPAELRFPIKNMEGILVNAVTEGAEKVAEQIHDIAPQLPLFTGEAKAHGVPLAGYGVVFYLEIPSIRVVSVETFRDMLAPDPKSGGGRPVSTAPRPDSAAAITQQRIADSEVFQDPRKVYRRSVREALTDAMLKYGSSGDIPFQSTEYLTVWACPDEPSNTSPSTMVLRVSGTDLQAFRERKITIEQARARVEVVQF